MQPKLLQIIPVKRKRKKVITISYNRHHPRYDDDQLSTLDLLAIIIVYFPDALFRDNLDSDL